jgi:sigma-B regulation protein RsbU (phosphoserine phosphatase)
VGTLCVLDHAPRLLSEGQQRAMETLARSASRYLELRRTMGRLAREIEARRGAEAQLRQSLEVIHRDIQEAAAFVASMLPPPCEQPARIRWAFAPSAELGGDGLGHLRCPQGQLAFFVLDVCGHGTASALLSVAIVSALRSDTFPVDRSDPGAVVAMLNRMFPAEHHHRLHFTLWYGVLEPGTGELRYVSAGHPAPVLLRPEQPVLELQGEGPLVGILPGASWQVHRVQLAPGDRVLVFSDGAVELFSPSGERLSERRFLEQLACSADDGSAPAAFLAFARAFCGQEQLDDDFSMLELRL